MCSTPQGTYLTAFSKSGPCRAICEHSWHLIFKPCHCLLPLKNLWARKYYQYITWHCIQQCRWQNCWVVSVPTSLSFKDWLTNKDVLTEKGIFKHGACNPQPTALKTIRGWQLCRVLCCHFCLPQRKVLVVHSFEYISTIDRSWHIQGQERTCYLTSCWDKIQEDILSICHGNAESWVACNSFGRNKLWPCPSCFETCNNNYLWESGCTVGRCALNNGNAAASECHVCNTQQVCRGCPWDAVNLPLLINIKMVSSDFSINLSLVEFALVQQWN